MLELPPLSLYIHIPWCVRKCPYCDFNSHESAQPIDEESYLAALVEDFQRDAEHIQGRNIHSIFIGGGTPSLFSAATYEKLFSAISQIVQFEPDMECTLEANPGSADASRFAEYRQIGINRLSIGIQSFNDQSLSILGRIHDGEQARQAIESCREAGFDNFNLDLMFGLPEQEIAGALLDLRTALEYAPKHISWYQLTIEPNTAYYSKPPPLPDEDTILSIQENGIKLLVDAGLDRYEISAFAKTGKQSIHNLNYWKFGDYIGIGAGAHGKISFPEQNTIIRTRKIRQPKHYLANNVDYVAERTAVAESDLNIEFMMNALRLINGFDVSLYEGRTGSSFSNVRKKIKYLVSERLLQEHNGQIMPSVKGRMLVNSLLGKFL